MPFINREVSYSLEFEEENSKNYEYSLFISILSKMQLNKICMLRAMIMMLSKLLIERVKRMVVLMLERGKAIAECMRDFVLLIRVFVKL